MSISVGFRDGDGVLDEFDNCPDLPNGEQGDAEGDRKGGNNVQQNMYMYLVFLGKESNLF